MPITRTPIVDDDGTGTTGTVLDNAWKQELYNQIDTLVPSTAAGWASYVPAWGALGTAPTLGNGTITASYVQVNGITYFEIYLTMGSTTTFGAANNWTLTTPTDPLKNGSGCMFILTGRGYHVATGASWALAGAVPVGGGQFVLMSSVESVGANYPFTWAAGDVLQVAGMYRSA